MGFFSEILILNTFNSSVSSFSFLLETNESEEQKEYAKKNAKDIFIVLIIITVLGTTLASPTATLADTATLENLGINIFLILCSMTVLTQIDKEEFEIYYFWSKKSRGRPF